MQNAIRRWCIPGASAWRAVISYHESHLYAYDTWYITDTTADSPHCKTTANRHIASRCWLTPTADLHLHTCVRQQVWKHLTRVQLVSSFQDTIASLTHLIKQTCILSCCSPQFDLLGNCVGATRQMKSCLHVTKASKHHQEACCRAAQICSTQYVHFEIVCTSTSLSNTLPKATRKCWFQQILLLQIFHNS